MYRWKNQEGFNRKGYGPFLSKNKRLLDVPANTPGPGNYQLCSSLTTLDSENTSIVREARLAN
jgi:hypothetical protein